MYIKYNSISPLYKEKKQTDSFLHVTFSLPAAEYPSCLHATAASWPCHILLQILPQIPLKQISTLPSSVVEPLTSRISPSEQFVSAKSISGRSISCHFSVQQWQTCMAHSTLLLQYTCLALHSGSIAACTV